MNEESIDQAGEEPGRDEEALSGQNLLSQIAITIFLGIPMTLALGIALVGYFIYEFVKYQITGKPPLGPDQTVIGTEPNTRYSLWESDESTITNTLMKLAEAHGSVRRADIQSRQYAGSGRERDS